MGQLALQALIALLWAPLIAWMISTLGYHINWVGVAGSVALGVAFGVAVGVAGGVVGSTVHDVTGGVAVGVAAGVAGGVAIGVAGDVAAGVAAGVTIGVAVGVVTGVAGVVFGVAGSVAIGAAAGAAAGAISVLTLTHLVHLLVQYPTSLVTWWLVRLAPDLSTKLWQISPVRWDEVILLPLPGLDTLLATLYRQDRTAGQAALVEVAAHRYQRSAAHKALVQLARQDAELVTSLPALAGFGQGLDWLSDDTPLPDPVRRSVLGMRDISNEVASAQASDSATNRVRRLEAAADGLASLRQQQRVEEPIPQVYIGDGRPIRPAGRPDSALPFKGRAALFRQLEGALGGREGERATFLLYGPRRTGKTSALMQLPRRLGSRVIPAFLDLQSEKLGGAQDAAGVLAGLANELVDEARRHRGVSLPALDRKTLAQDAYPAFGRWLDKVESALGKRTLLLCLDEFEALEKAIQDKRLDERILAMLRNMVQHRRRIEVLLSGSHRIDELAPHWASALVTTTTLAIGFLAESDTRELIERPVADFPAIYTPGAVDRIVRVTHCQPHLVQLMCTLLVERMNAARRMPPASFVAVDDVNAVMPLALERGQNYFIDLWRSQAEGELAHRVLDALAACPLDAPLPRTQLRSIERDEMVLSETIRRLLRREIIEPVDDGYRITVPLVSEYICRQKLL